MSIIILGIETSCDETAASLVEDGKRLLSNTVRSQIDVHKLYGGVVPELASRKHIESIIQVVDMAIKDSNVDIEDIDAVAVTQGPGLVGSLLVGLSHAKAISYALSLPLIGINHLEAHISVSFLENSPEFPFIGLIVSGGHTNLYYVNDFTKFKLIGKTLDDAAGEAFDKAAKTLGLEYPGGIEIDRLAKMGDREQNNFPIPLESKDTLDFSFSGLKTSLIYYLNKNPIESDQQLKDVCASYQESIVQSLVRKTLDAAEKYGVNAVVLSGGVACNSRLRELAESTFKSKGIKVYIPSPIAMYG